MAFSNSLIIHDENTKEITTVKEVGIPGLNLHRFWRFYSFVSSAFNDQFEKVYHLISKHLEVGLIKLGCASFFNPFRGVWICDEALFLVFDILRKNMKNTFAYAYAYTSVYAYAYTDFRL